MKSYNLPAAKIHVAELLKLVRKVKSNAIEREVQQCIANSLFSSASLILLLIKLMLRCIPVKINAFMLIVNLANLRWGTKKRIFTQNRDIFILFW